MTKRRLFAIALLALLATTAAVPAAEDWPQFRGPSQQGWAESSHPPTTWSETQNIAWKTPIPGLGWSSPVILAKQIWMTTATDDGKSLRAICVDQDSGKITHDVEVFAETQLAPKNAFNSYASPTPVLEQGRVYVSFGTYGSACLDADTAAIIWKNNDLRLDHKEGPGSSPIIWGNEFILHCDGTNSPANSHLKFNAAIPWPRSSATSARRIPPPPSRRSTAKIS
jgi:outer membrane protein assembly factor BamB